MFLQSAPWSVFGALCRPIQRGRSCAGFHGFFPSLDQRAGRVAIGPDPGVLTAATAITLRVGKGFGVHRRLLAACLRNNLAGEGQKRPRNGASGASSSVTRWPCAIPRALRIDQGFALPITSVDPSSAGRRVGAFRPYNLPPWRHQGRDDQVVGAAGFGTVRNMPILTASFHSGAAAEGQIHIAPRRRMQE